MSKVSEAKYKNTILFLCKNLGGSLHGKKKLAKLLYFVDFDRYEYEESGKSVTGDIYNKLPMGPVPSMYMKVVDDLVRSHALSVNQQEYMPGYSPVEVYKCLVEPDLSVFDKDDIKIMERVVSVYGGLNGKQLEELSHVEAPFIGTEPNQEIPYELAYYRETAFDDIFSAPKV